MLNIIKYDTLNHHNLGPSISSTLCHMHGEIQSFKLIYMNTKVCKRDTMSQHDYLKKRLYVFFFQKKLFHINQF
jgi:hypothetical protein